MNKKKLIFYLQENIRIKMCDCSQEINISKMSVNKVISIMWDNVPHNIKLELADYEIDHTPPADVVPTDELRELWKELKLKIFLEQNKTIKDKLVCLDKVTKIGFRHARERTEHSREMLRSFVGLLNEIEDWESFKVKRLLINSTIDSSEVERDDNPPEYCEYEEQDVDVE